MNTTKKKKIDKAAIIRHTFFILFCLACLLPFLLVVSISISSEMDITRNGYSLIPRGIDFTAYKFVFANTKELFDAYKVSILVTVIATILSTFIKLLAAYPLSRMDFKIRKPVMFLIFFTMLFNGGLVPSYILITQYLHLQNTIWVMIIPALISPWDIIIMRTFIQRQPIAIFESARIDGASEIRIFFKIVIPLAKPIIATLALFYALVKWNDWFTPLLYIRKQELYPIQYMLQKVLMDLQFLIDHAQDVPAGMSDVMQIPGETMRMALAVIAAGPMVIIFPFFQKYFAKGITLGSVKG